MGWTQKRLAEVTDSPEQTISLVINGKKRLTPYRALKIATALELEPLSLLMAQADYELRKFEKANPDLADEVSVRVKQLSQESE
jgi:plasmid maintenance system antidote protein VapI